MAWLFLLVLGALGFVSLSRAVPARYETLDSRCEPLRITMCKSLPYNETHFPNLLGHETQNEANVEITSFKPLVSVNCSSDLRRFLCSVYAPICVPISGTLRLLPPCRHNCKRVKKGCIKILKQYGFKWPDALKCSKFPKKKSSAPCVDWGSKAATKAGRKKQKNNRRKGKKGSLRKKKGGNNRKVNGKDKVGQNPDKNGRKKNKKNKRRKHKRNGKKRKKGKGRGKKKDRKSKKNRENEAGTSNKDKKLG